MNKVTFVHVGDVHLDSPFSSVKTFTEDGIRKNEILRKGLRISFEKVISYAKTNKVDVLLLTGDLFESNYTSKSTLDFLNRLFINIEDVDICIVPGNHDPATKESPYKTYSWASNVHILLKENYVFENAVKKFRVYGVGFYEHHVEESLVSYITNIKNDDFAKILLYHGDVLESGKSKYSSTTKQELVALNMDYIAMGHIHDRMENVLNIQRCNYAGILEANSFSTLGETGFYYGSLTQGDALRWHVTSEFISNNTREYIKSTLDIGIFEDKLSTLEKLKIYIGDLKSPDKNPIWLTLRGSKKVTQYLDIYWISEELNKLFFLVRLDNNLTTEYSFTDFDGETGIVKEFIDICKDNMLKVQEQLIAFKTKHGLTDAYVNNFENMYLSELSNTYEGEAEQVDLLTDSDKATLHSLLGNLAKEEAIFLKGIQVLELGGN